MPALVLLLVAGVILLPWLGETLFNSKGEPREAIVAVTMLQTGNWILPVNFGGDIPFKPPFLAWCIALLAQALNGGAVNEYISRLPSALALIAMLMAGYRWACRCRGERFAMIMALVTLTSMEVLRDGIVCRLDMVLTACMVCAMYIMYDIHERPGRRRWSRWLAVVFLLNCAVCTKGPVGALLPCFIIGVYRLLRGDRFLTALWQMLLVALLSMTTTAVWFVAAMEQGGQHFVDLMYEENFGRLFGTMSYSSHERPFWYNFETLAIGLLPWTLLALLALIDARRWRRAALKPAGMLAATAAVLTVLFYCIPVSKRSVYLLPAYPFVCYGIASIIEAIADTRVLKTFTWLLALIAIALMPVAATVLPGFEVKSGIALEPLPWWGYVVLAVPAATALMWAATRRSPVGYSLAIAAGLALGYTAVLQPAVFNPLSDANTLSSIDPDRPVRALAEEGAPYVLNFYLADRIRPLAPEETAEQEPGTQIVYFNDDHTPRLHDLGYRTATISPYSNERRRPMYLAVKQTPTESADTISIRN